MFSKSSGLACAWAMASLLFVPGVGAQPATIATDLQEITVSFERAGASDSVRLNPSRVRIADHEFDLSRSQPGIVHRIAVSGNGEVTLEVAGYPAPIPLGHAAIPEDLGAGEAKQVVLINDPALRVYSIGHRNGVPYPGDAGTGFGLVRKRRETAQVEYEGRTIVQFEQTVWQKLTRWREWVNTGLSVLHEVRAFDVEG